MADAVPVGQRKIVADAPTAPVIPVFAASEVHCVATLPLVPSPRGLAFPLPMVLSPMGTPSYQRCPIFVPVPNEALVIARAAAVPVPCSAVVTALHPRPGLRTIAAPVGCGLDKILRGNVEEMRDRLLAQFMDMERLVPSRDEELKRFSVILQLKKVIWILSAVVAKFNLPVLSEHLGDEEPLLIMKNWIVLIWIKKVALSHQLCKDVIESTSATILPFGSYGLGVHGPESDIDVLCVGPYYASLEGDFFGVLCGMLQNRPEVTEVHCVTTAKVPLIRFKFNGISVDLPYAQINALSVPDNINPSDLFLVRVDETSWRSLSGVRANRSIHDIVPNLKSFQAMLRCLKIWARRRGIYSHLFGFFGGIHLAILSAYVCRRFPDASVSALISTFFDIFLHWPWPEPVALHDKPVHIQHFDSRSFMPIAMPCSPYDLCNSNITRSTFNKIKMELLRGYSLTKDLKPDLDLCSLFEPFPYTKRHMFFLRISLVAPNAAKLQDWVGWVKSRFRSLLLMLEDTQGYCDPNPTEYMNHNITEPNTVFYWGLSLTDRSLMDTKIVKDEFMKSLTRDNHGSCSGSSCRLELSVVEASQLPKSMLLDSEHSGEY